MLPRKVSIRHILIAWVLVTIPSVMISFEWTLPIYNIKAKEINNFIQGWSFAFSSSLLFWMITEFLLERKRSREVAEAQRAFLDGVIGQFNETVEGFISKGKPKENHFTTLPEHKLYEAIEQWASAQPKDGSEWAITMMRWFRDDVEKREADISYYRGSFSQAFNTKLNDLLREFNSSFRYIESGTDKRFEIAMAHLAMFRSSMIELDNIYRSEHRMNQLQYPS